MLIRVIAILFAIVTIIHPAFINENGPIPLKELMYLNTTFGIVMWSIFISWIIYPIFLNIYIAYKSNRISNKSKEMIWQHTEQLKKIN